MAILHSIRLLNQFIACNICPIMDLKENFSIPQCTLIYTIMSQTLHVQQLHDQSSPNSPLTISIHHIRTPTRSLFFIFQSSSHLLSQWYDLISMTSSPIPHVFFSFIQFIYITFFIPLLFLSAMENGHPIFLIHVISPPPSPPLSWHKSSSDKL